MPPPPLFSEVISKTERHKIAMAMYYYVKKYEPEFKDLVYFDSRNPEEILLTKPPALGNYDIAVTVGLTNIIRKVPADNEIINDFYPLLICTCGHFFSFRFEQL